MALPQSAGDAGANLHNNFLDTIRNLPGLVLSAAKTVPVAAPVVEGVRAAPQMAATMQDFFHGLASGQARLAQLGEARPGSVTVALPAPGGSSSATTKAQAKTTGGGIKAPVYTQAYLDAQPNFVQQAAAAAAGKDAPASTKAAASAKVTNPFDEAIARFAQANGGISLNELGALADAAYKTAPLRMQPKDPSSKDQVIANIFDLQRQRLAADLANAPTRAKAAGLSQDDFVRKATDAYISQLMPIVGTNPIDFNVAGSMPTPGAAE
jgi:hypothetical protein